MEDDNGIDVRQLLVVVRDHGAAHDVEGVDVRDMPREEVPEHGCKLFRYGRIEPGEVEIVHRALL